MKTYCYKDGKILASEKILISAYDIGFLRGYAIFDALSTHNKKPFYLKAHLTRFRKSAIKLNLKIPVSDKRIEEIIKTLIIKNKFSRTNIKIILSGGNTINGLEYNPNKPTFFILAEKWHPLPKQLYKEGAKLVIENYQRFMPEIKTNHYITAVKLQTKQKIEKAIEILYTSNAKALECSTSNIFIFRKNTLITPKDNVLLGITRLATLEIAKKHFKIEEREISVSEFLKADEIFITSSFKDILPITIVGNKIIGGGKVGKNTEELMRLFTISIKNY